MTTAMDSSIPSIPEFSLGDRMWKSRKNAGIKTSEMARRFRVTPTTIGNWEAERRHPSFTDLRVWADECNVPLNWLMTGDPNSPNPQIGQERVPGQLVLPMPGYAERPVETAPLELVPAA